MEIQEFINKYKSYVLHLDKPLVKKAIEFAIKYHGDQKRASGEAYYHHPLQVAEIIAKLRLDTDSIVTAILHDTIEDTDLTFQDIEKNFSTNIANLVEGVTKLNKIEFKTQNVRQAENFRKLLLAMSDDIRVLLIKLADRLHNMRTIDYISSAEKKQRIALETMEIYAPLAERIGVHQIKSELQDISFRVLNPEVRDSIISRFKSIEHDQGNFVNLIIEEIEKTLESKNIRAKISGRRKTPYSTWMKMKQKNISIDQLYDIIAFRIVVDNIDECYKVLGVIHQSYKMIPDKFQDFMSTPKNNGYQSIHTVVMGPLMQKIEIQIRTKEMHDIAELGVAAHWKYKQGYEDASDGSKYSWIRELLAILENNNSPDEFLQNTKLAMYYDQVFCFTPKGHLIALPKGAIVVDFAYMVSSDIGNSCSGAKVNGKMVPLGTQLNNGDQVEIIPSKTETVLTYWENFVVTGKARSEIRKRIRAQQYSQYIKLGKNIISKALKAENIKNTPQVLLEVGKKFSKSVDELLFSIGKGSIAREEFIQQVKPKQSKLHSTLSIFKLNRKKKVDNSIPIKGLISGIAIHYAKCCHPLVGDKIVGVIHTGSGITIHTADCEMVKNFSAMPDRILDLTWDNEVKNKKFISRINVVILNEVSALAVISEDIGRNNSNIMNIKIKNRNQKYFEMIFDIEVESLDHLEKVINSLRTKNVVQKIGRKTY